MWKDPSGQVRRSGTLRSRAWPEVSARLLALPVDGVQHAIPCCAALLDQYGRHAGKAKGDAAPHGVPVQRYAEPPLVAVEDPRAGL
eukprot:6277022-Alexandrium_andersonii.AAC.1